MLVVGLGNPGDEYTHTRHNVGKLVIDLMGELDGCKLCKSDEYMNNSGRYVRRLLQETGQDPSDLIIIHDDWAFSLGDFRVQFGRGANSHKGVQSVIDALGGQGFWRVCIGIGSVPEGMSGEDYVLGKFNENELKEIGFLVHKIKPAIVELIQGKDDSII